MLSKIVQKITNKIIRILKLCVPQFVMNWRKEIRLKNWIEGGRPVPAPSFCKTKHYCRISTKIQVSNIYRNRNQYGRDGGGSKIKV